MDAVQVIGCDANECAFNRQGECHGLAITVGAVPIAAAIRIGRVGRREACLASFATWGRAKPHVAVTTRI